MIGLALIFATPATGKVYWGLRTGVCRSSLVQQIDLDYLSGSRLGYSLAALADIPFYQRFSFRPELAMVYEGGSFFSEPDESFFLQKHVLRAYALQPSLDVAFTIPISGVRMAIYAGPTLDFHLWNTTTAEKVGSWPGSPTKKEIKPFDLAINAGISVEYKGVFFSITTFAGTFERQAQKTEEESSVYQNNLTFSLGYFFR
jgi:hypothetical protein